MPTVSRKVRSILFRTRDVRVAFPFRDLGILTMPRCGCSFLSSYKPRADHAFPSILGPSFRDVGCEAIWVRSYLPVLVCATLLTNSPPLGSEPFAEILLRIVEAHNTENGSGLS